MAGRLFYIKVKILKAADHSSFPGWVECLFVDVWGVEHIFIEKTPVVTCKNINFDSKFPQDGFIRCELLKEWIDDSGRRIATISTEIPDHVETLHGVNTFDTNLK